MTLWDGIGYLAASLVLLAFCQKQMVPLRIAALDCSGALDRGPCTLARAKVDSDAAAVVCPVRVPCSEPSEGPPRHKHGALLGAIKTKPLRGA